MAPIWLFEIEFDSAVELASRIMIACPPALHVIVIVEDPSKLPILLPVTVPTSYRPEARNIPLKTTTPFPAVLRLIPEIVLF